MAEFAAVVLAGGRARRLGGVDKLLLPIGGRTLLDRTLDAVAAADPLVVVGPPRTTARPVRWTAEDPPSGGPLAGLQAGLAQLPLETRVVAVLAGDHPHLTPATITRLLDALRAVPEAAGAVLSDPGERLQWLVGVWRAGALREAMPADVRNRPLRAVLAPLAPLTVRAVEAEASDVDTPEDLRRAHGTSE
ncbi:Molybdopterin-guanine dinucleotide biosynthesis protein A [Saccharopolyspora kobensis]|uniref:Probable molybdenum cofactor guanylyltransferase n=1 Tax=Saccharopolyspora kobensis TaxID=146035 RepID=A0A1H5XDE6_9PSEU|nr:molybdenum cofactor guanylyltransferase [Saccharopolyspora kobensis]SEG09804.1 Molybdopterin-guanine dinucleotide biosynthesis protein A [Saccharopolyspora kobensis]SFE44204.1 Molybdopterin-guanine dinucleotide biosynthesis protein A [Saccharopolyspora kobensis]